MKQTQGRPLPLLLAAGAMVLLAVTFIAGSFRLGFVVDQVPGPGLLPLIAGSVLLLLALHLLLREPVLPDEDAGFDARPLAGIVMLGIFAVLLPVTGFVAATGLLVLAWGRSLYRQSWAASLLLAVLLTAAAIGVFRGLLGMALPLWPAFLLPGA